MLFNSVVFIFFFFPMSWIFYFLSKRFSTKLGFFSLVLFSSIFYAWKEHTYLFIIFGSIAFNFLLANILCRCSYFQKLRFAVFLIGISLNIGILLYFKYYNFILRNFNFLFGIQISMIERPLPLAISFFTFQQISFLVSFYKKELDKCNFFSYCSSILFFPHLLAGPIIRPVDLMPQLEKKSKLKINKQNIAIGLTIFVIGLFKKVILADSAAIYVDMIFNIVNNGFVPSFCMAWIGILLFSFQIYFDFSGYSDMAIGLARLFNIHFPINFNSPYKSTSIIFFWRNWHITLSSFLRDNVYIPLGGSRQSPFNKYNNLLLTMLIGGLWHGASWNFVIWGGLHGVYLCINHWIKDLKVKKMVPSVVGFGEKKEPTSSKFMSFASNLKKQDFSARSYNQTSRFSISFLKSFLLFANRMSIFLLVSVTWVFFRATKFSTSIAFLRGVLGLNSIKFPKIFSFLNSCHDTTILLNYKPPFIIIIILFCICMFLPNVYAWLIHYNPASNINNASFLENNWLSFKTGYWKPTILYALFIFFLFIFACNGVDDVSQFIYYRF